MTTFLSLIAILVTTVGSYYAYKSYVLGKENKNGLINVNKEISNMNIKIEILQNNNVKGIVNSSFSGDVIGNTIH